MAKAVGAVVASIYGLLSLFHVLWALGVKLGGGGVIPEVGGKPTFAPSATATWAVAFALAAASAVVLAIARIIRVPLPDIVIRSAATLLGLLFILRAIGDFRLVGFFKKVSATSFARNDTYVFAPLCMALGSAVLWLAFVDWSS